MAGLECRMPMAGVEGRCKTPNFRGRVADVGIGIFFFSTAITRDEKKNKKTIKIKGVDQLSEWMSSTKTCSSVGRRRVISRTTQRRGRRFGTSAFSARRAQGGGVEVEFG